MAASGAKVRHLDQPLLLGRRDPGDGLPRRLHDAVLLRLARALGARVPAAALRREDARRSTRVSFALMTVVLVRHLDVRDGQLLRAAHPRRAVQALGLGPEYIFHASVIALGDRRPRLHPARRPVERDLQRGPAVLPDRRPASCRSCISGMRDVGGWDGLARDACPPALTHAWRGMGCAGHQPDGRRSASAWRWGSASCCRSATGAPTSSSCSARWPPTRWRAARRTPLIAAFPKMLFPFLVILPGTDRARRGGADPALRARDDGSVGRLRPRDPGDAAALLPDRACSGSA